MPNSSIWFPAYVPVWCRLNANSQWLCSKQGFKESGSPIFWHFHIKHVASEVAVGREESKIGSVGDFRARPGNDMYHFCPYSTCQAQQCGLTWPPQRLDKVVSQNKNQELLPTHALCEHLCKAECNRTYWRGCCVIHCSCQHSSCSLDLRWYRDC